MGSVGVRTLWHRRGGTLALVLLALLALGLLLLWSQEDVAVVAAAAGALIISFCARFVPAVARRLRAAVIARPRSKAKVPDPGFDGLPVALLRLTGEGEVVAANGAARQLMGPFFPDPAMAHELFEDMGRPVSDWLRDVAAGRHPGGSEVVRLSAGGHEAERFVQLTAQRLGEDHVLAVLQDATAMKRLEAQFTQSQKMQAIGQLAGGIAHDFNNLLTAITGHCDLLLLRHRPDDLDHADLQQIQQNAYRAGALVRQLLAFSRKQTMVPEPIELTEALGELTHLLNRLLGGAVRLHLDHAQVAVTLRADRRQLEQVIINLAVNARDAMPSGGILQIATDLVTLSEGMPRAGAVVPAGQYATIRIRDTGVGMDADVLGKIFEPFFTTKRAGEGTGLGLSTVYGIVKQSGGYVFVESSPGAGTEFELWFPASPDVARPARCETVAARNHPLGDGVVLLVEDEAPVRAFAARALRMRGLSVVEAETGEQALEMLAAPLHVDLIVSDVALPGLTGPAWVREALIDRPETPVIFMSGYAADPHSEAQSRIENSVFLAKPFSLAELTETVMAQLPRRARAAPDQALRVS